MFRSMRKGYWAAAAALICASALAAEGPITLAYNYKSGAVNRMKQEISASVMGTDVQIVQTVKSTVKEIKPNGDIVIESASEGGKMSLGGQEQELPAAPAGSEVRTKLGKLVEHKSPDNPGDPFTPEIHQLMAAIQEPVFPAKAVSAGDTWQIELDNPAVKGKKLTLKGAFTGIEKLDGVDLWKVKQTAEADTSDKDKLSYEITSWVNPATGHTAKAEAVMKDVPTQYGMMTLNFKITQLKELDKK